MRTHIFKAKRMDNNKWVVGNLAQYIEGIKATIYCDNYGAFDKQMAYCVDPNTVCQCKEFPDKNGTNIFDEDICVYSNSLGEYGVGIIQDDYVKWISGNVREKHIMTPLFYLKCSEEWEVIGNTFDNPELLND